MHLKKTHFGKPINGQSMFKDNANLLFQNVNFNMLHCSSIELFRKNDTVNLS